MTRGGDPSTPTACRGRRPGSSGTRQAILDATRTRFAEDGHAALVMQFIGSKEEPGAAVVDQHLARMRKRRWWRWAVDDGGAGWAGHTDAQVAVCLHAATDLT